MKRVDAEKMQASGEGCVMAFEEGEEDEASCYCCERAQWMQASVRGRSVLINMKINRV